MSFVTCAIKASKCMSSAKYANAHVLQTSDRHRTTSVKRFVRMREGLGSALLHASVVTLRITDELLVRYRKPTGLEDHGAHRKTDRRSSFT